MRRSVFLAAVLAVAATAFPAAAQARKDAWQYVSVTGGYTYHATATSAPACGTGTVDEPPLSSVLSRDHSETFKGVKFGAGRYVAKYMPAVFGPATVAQGQDVTLERQFNDRETYRLIDTAADGSCTQTETSCSLDRKLSTREHPLNLFPQSKGKKLRVSWSFSFGNTVEDCVPKGSTSGLQGALKPEIAFGDKSKAGTVPSTIIKGASTSVLRKGKSTFILKGSTPVSGTGFTGTLDYNAKVVLKRLKIAEPCKLVKPQGFTCSL